MIYVCQYCDIGVAETKEGWDRHVKSCPYYRWKRGEISKTEFDKIDNTSFTDPQPTPMLEPAFTLDLEPPGVRINDLRDWYAAMAMQSLIIIFGPIEFDTKEENKEKQWKNDVGIAKASYEIADAMLKKREERNNEDKS